jgi:hypothetical protein
MEKNHHKHVLQNFLHQSLQKNDKKEFSHNYDITRK